MVRIILEIFFIEIIIKRKWKDTTGVKLSLLDFTTLVRENSFFIRYRPDNELLTKIFQIIDTNRDNWITLTEYMNFIRQYLGRGLTIID